MSLFDQFQESVESLQSSAVAQEQPIIGRPVAVLEREDLQQPRHLQQEAMFALDPVQYQFPQIRDIVVSNSVLVAAVHDSPKTTASKPEKSILKVLRIDLDKPDAVQELLLPATRHAQHNSIHKLFLDPQGKHLIISCSNGDNYYVNHSWRKPKLLTRIKGVQLESVAWGRAPADQSTGVILLGSKQGCIYEGIIKASEDFFKKEDRFFKQLFTIGNGLLPVFVVTSQSIYQFIGDVAEDLQERGVLSFINLFHYYDTNPVTHQEFPGALHRSMLQCWSPFIDNSYPSLPTCFGWMTEPGVFYGGLTFGNQNPGDSVIEDAQLLPYPETVSEKAGKYMQTVPLSVCLTEFHIILLYKSRVKAVSLFTKSVVFDEAIPLKEHEKVLGLEKDLLKGSFWIFTNQVLYEFLITDEDRDVWSLQLSKGHFEAALNYAKTDEQKEHVTVKQAEHYFSQGRYALSAQYYAMSVTASFEEIALKFMKLTEQEALQTYLVKKLERIKKQDIIQTTVLCAWLLELFLNKINLLEEQWNSSKQVSEMVCSPTSSSSQHSDSVSVNLASIEDDLGLTVQELKDFLVAYKDRLPVSTVYKLIRSHGRTDEYLFFAELIQDWEKLVGHWIMEKNWPRALDVLSRQSNLDLYYKHSSVLMLNSPTETVNLWTRQSNLNPKHLIPSLMSYNMTRSSNIQEENEAMRYLQFAISQNGNLDPVVHNFLLNLYVQQARVDAESSLLAFLLSQNEFPRYDAQYALRLCSQNGLLQSCIHIYSHLGLYEAAVDLALKMDDVELARVNADRPDEYEGHVRKKLWLKIAKHVVQKKNDIKNAMQSLEKCELLKLDDILPFFPDFVLIDDFKDEICAALEAYNDDIDELKSELTDAIKSADCIRVDIRELKHRFAKVPVIQTCFVCSLPCLIRQFYVFSCQHVFHSDCLTNKVIQNSAGPRARRIQDIQAKITADKTNVAQLPASSLEVVSQRHWKEMLDELVAGECILCGEAMIRTVDEHFISEIELASWA